MSGTKVAVLLTAAGMAAALLSACGTDDAAGPSSSQTEQCPEAKSGDEFEDKPQSDIDDVEVDLRDPKVEVDLNQAGALWAPEITNDSGQDLSDAALEISANYVEDCQQPLAVSNDPDECSASEEEEPGCTAREAAAEDCDYTEASGEPGSGHGARASCVKDVPTGAHEFTLELKMPGYEGAQDLSDIDDYPDLALHARLVVDDEVVASASSPVTVAVDPALDRVEITGVPAELSSDDATVYDWNFTLTNDTDHELEDATALIDAGSDRWLSISSERRACQRTEFGDIECELETLPAGESVDVDLRLWASGDSSESSHVQRVTVTVSEPDATPDNPDQRHIFGAGAAATALTVVK